VLGSLYSLDQDLGERPGLKTHNGAVFCECVPDPAVVFSVAAARQGPAAADEEEEEEAEGEAEAEAEAEALIVDLKRHTQLAVAWNRHGSLVPRWA